MILLWQNGDGSESVEIWVDREQLVSWSDAVNEARDAELDEQARRIAFLTRFRYAS
jgi:hypothetical protein